MPLEDRHADESTQGAHGIDTLIANEKAKIIESSLWICGGELAQVGNGGIAWSSSPRAVAAIRLGWGDRERWKDWRGKASVCFVAGTDVLTVSFVRPGW